MKKEKLIPDARRAVNEYGNSLYRLCSVITGNREDASDAVQDCFLKYVEKAPEFNDAEHEKAWLIKVASNICKDILRKRKHYSFVSLDEIRNLGTSENNAQILGMLVSLEEKYRIVIHLHYVEGCTAPTYSTDSLHAAVVEIFVKRNAKCRYSTIQNWSNNIVNLVTKRAYVEEGGMMDWVDGNIGSQLNMKYPACVLAGKGAKGNCISIAVASKGQYQDAGAKMIHLAEDTTSVIISKSIVHGGGVVNYRGKVFMGPKAKNSKSHVECDTLIMDNISKTDTIPENTVQNNQSNIEHEATVSKVSEEQLFYLMSRGLSKEDATQMIVMGFIEPFSKELPMEYAVELNQLLKLNMEGSVG